MAENERIQTAVIGGGQAGLAVGYHLAKRNLPFVILDAADQIGDAWRTRWDTLHLFTPASLSGLPGMPFPADNNHFPSKDEMADYLQAYADRFKLPVRSQARVERLTRSNGQFHIQAGNQHLEAENVIVAMGSFQVPHVPDFAASLDPEIVQLHASQYRNLDQLKPGRVLIVGAGNSGAEIALETAHSHPTWLSGRSTGSVPFSVNGFVARALVFPVLLPALARWILTVDTPIGRRIRPFSLSRGAPLVRVKEEDLANAGVTRVGRVTAARSGLPVIEDDQLLETENVIWCTGFRPSFSWIDLPVFGEQPPVEPEHQRGVVPDMPGLYFVGLWFQYSAASGVIAGVGRDAEYVVRHLATRIASTGPT